MDQIVTELEVKTTAELLGGARFVHYWPFISSQLDFIPHVWATWYTKETLREGVLSGRYQCWAVGDEKSITVVAFSQIAEFPANRIFQVFLAFGQEIEGVAPILEAVWEKFASDVGCTICEVVGRPGWGPFLRKFGFRQESCTFTRAVKNLRIN